MPIIGACHAEMLLPFPASLPHGGNIEFQSHPDGDVALVGDG